MDLAAEFHIHLTSYVLGCFCYCFFLNYFCKCRLLYKIVELNTLKDKWKCLFECPVRKAGYCGSLNEMAFLGVFYSIGQCIDLANLMLSLSAMIKAWMFWIKWKPYLTFIGSMGPYRQALPSAWQVKIQLYFLYIAIAAMLQKRRLFGREEINLKLITRSLALLLILLIPECIKRKLSETGLGKMSRVYFCLDWSFWSLK